MNRIEKMKALKAIKLPCTETAIANGVTVHTEHLGVRDKTRVSRLEKAEKAKTFDDSTHNNADDWLLRKQLGM